MEIKVKQEKFGMRSRYSIFVDGEPKFKAEANFGIIEKKRIDLYEAEGDVIACLTQKNFYDRFLHNIPFYKHKFLLVLYPCRLCSNLE